MPSIRVEGTSNHCDHVARTMVGTACSPPAPFRPLRLKRYVFFTSVKHKESGGQALPAEKRPVKEERASAPSQHEGSLT